ncbi:MAG: DUF58 domain-containing protein [Lachnospiraceae bacterium]|nr:DUF58 domain-containing protein [Lachnospiraceae bacterium]
MKLRNLPYIITYILCLAVFFLGVLFYRQSLLSVLIILFIVLPPVSICLTGYASRRLRVSFDPPRTSVTPGGIARFSLSVDNPGFIPLLNVLVELRYENLYYPREDISEIVVPAEIRTKKQFSLPFELTKAGMFSVSVRRILVTDFLHLYTKELKSDITVLLPVIPDEQRFEDTSFPKAAVESEDSELSPDGELINEIKQLREYRPGDRLKDIHWKQSARSKDLMVKEYETSSDLYFLILPELERSTLDRGINEFAKTAYTLLSMKESFRVAIWHDNENLFEFVKVSSRSDLDIAFYKLYLEPVYETSGIYDKFNALYPEMYGVLRISGGKLLLTEEA